MDNPKYSILTGGIIHLLTGIFPTNCIKKPRLKLSARPANSSDACKAQPGKVLTTPWVLLGRLGLVVYGTTLVTQKIDEPMGNMINMVVFISVTSQTSLFELVVGGVTKQFCQDRLGVFFHSKTIPNLKNGVAMSFPARFQGSKPRLWNQCSRPSVAPMI